MLLVVILTWILAQMGVAEAAALWAWFAGHPLITLLLILFLA